MSPAHTSPSPLRVAVIDDYQQVAGTIVDWAAGLPGVDMTFIAEPYRDAASLAERLQGIDVVVAMRERTPFDRDLLARLPDLRLLVTTGMRNAAIDFEAARAIGLTVCGTRSLPWGAAELAWGLILSLTRRIPAEDALIRAGGWQGSVGTYLDGRTLGVVGLGKLGQRVATIGRAFGMEVVAWSPNLTAERAGEGGATLVAKDELFRSADVVSIHMVLGDSTRGLVGEPELRAMAPTAYLVNTSRGGLIDEPALLRALDEGWIAGAGLDVFDQEPLPVDHPLRAAPRTVLTSHLGFVTGDNYRLFYSDAIEDIAAWIGGVPLRVMEGSGW